MRFHLQEVRAADLAPSRVPAPHLAATARGFDAAARAADRRRRAATTRGVIPGRPGDARASRPQPNAGSAASGRARTVRRRHGPAGRRSAGVVTASRSTTTTASETSEVEHYRARRTRRRHPRRPPRRANGPPHLPRSRLHSARPSDRLPLSPTPCSSSCSDPLPACRRPASGLPPSRLGCPARFIWQVEEGPSSAKRWTALPRKPRRDAGSRPEAGRRPGSLEGDHQERTTYSEPPTANHPEGGRDVRRRTCRSR